MQGTRSPAWRSAELSGAWTLLDGERMHPAKLVLALSLASALASADSRTTTITNGEVIVIRDRVTPAVKPKPKNWSREQAPPYSDRAIVSDAWTKAHLLLDIDERGVVTRFKWLKRPGFDLEPIAVAQISGLRFEPARNADGAAIKSYNTWEIEWPSAGWLVAFIGTRTRMPPLRGFPARRMDASVPCKDHGEPMHLFSLYPVLRDCSKPELSRAVNEPWVAVRSEPASRDQ